MVIRRNLILENILFSSLMDGNTTRLKVVDFACATQTERFGLCDYEVRVRYIHYLVPMFDM